jgi:ribokinase
MKANILVMGSSNTDMIVRVPRLPQPGETILGGDFITAAGGKGANQAVAAARAGADVTFVGRVGSDLFGARALAGFARDRIRTNYVVRDPLAPSGVALIWVADTGQNSIAVASGANGRLTAADVRRARPAFARADALLMQLETPLPAVLAAAQLAAAGNIPILLNPAPARPLPDALLRRIAVLTPNETEAHLLTGIRVNSNAAAARAADRLHARGPQTVIITLGARGAFVSTRSDQQRVPGFKVKAVDTTAAGDIFNGALAVALAEVRTMTDAVRFACAAAALSITRRGAQPSAPTRAEIDRFLRGA